MFVVRDMFVLVGDYYLAGTLASASASILMINS